MDHHLYTYLPHPMAIQLTLPHRFRHRHHACYHSWQTQPLSPHPDCPVLIPFSPSLPLPLTSYLPFPVPPSSPGSPPYQGSPVAVPRRPTEHEAGHREPGVGRWFPGGERTPHVGGHDWGRPWVRVSQRGAAAPAGGAHTMTAGPLVARGHGGRHSLSAHAGVCIVTPHWCGTDVGMVTSQ